MPSFSAFAGAVAGHYTGKLAGLEIWAEESVGFKFWTPTLKGDPGAYATMLAGAHDAIKAADPGAQVVFGGCPFDPQLVPGAIEFQSEVFAAQPRVAQKFDKMGLHPYLFDPPSAGPEIYSNTEAPLVDKVQIETWLLSQVGASTVPIWATALGWPVTSDVDEAAQARYLVRATILAAQAGAEAIFWFTLRDGPNPMSLTAEDAFGLLHNDAQFDGGADGGREATPKRAYKALKTLLGTVGARWISGGTPNVAGLPADGFAVAFAGSDPGQVVALWTLGSTATVTLPGLHGQVSDELGAPLGPSDPGVAIGPDPVYVVAP
jgi:hypothetical protein